MPFKGLPLVLPAPPTPPTPRPAAQRLTLTLSRGGESLELPTWAPDGGWLVMPGVEGLDIPASQLLTQRAAGQWGTYVTGVDVDMRDVFLPLNLYLGTMSALLEEKDRFNRLTSPWSGEPVRLTVARPGGTSRWIEGHRRSEAPAWDGSWLGSMGRQTFGFRLGCPDPWWRGEPVTYSWQQGAQPEFFDPRGDGTFLPLVLAADRLLGSPVPVSVPGDVPSYPKWTVTGPATSVTATHVESGRSWTLTQTLLAGETAVIDTDPRVAATTGLQVTGPGGVDWWEHMVTYDLWPLPIGSQTVTISLAGSAEGSAAALEVTPMFETA